MKRLLFTLTLIGALSTSAFAGLIPSVGAPSPVTTAEKANSTSLGDGPSVDVALSAVLAALSLLS
jgi:hypothetical protein